MKARRDALIKEATTDLIKACGGLEQAARHCRARKSSLSNYASELHPESFIPADVLADLEAYSGKLLITFILAQNAAKPPEPEAPNPHKTVAELATKLGHFATEVEDAMSDGELSPAECKRLIDRLMALVTVVEKGRHDLNHHKVVKLRKRHAQQGGDG